MADYAGGIPFGSVDVEQDKEKRPWTRVQREVEQLQATDYCSDVEFRFEKKWACVTVSFRDPADESNKTYRVEFQLEAGYPFSDPRGFFIGEAPAHKFYDFDKNDGGRRSRTTNLAHTSKGCGGLFYNHSPRMSIKDYVDLILHSMTPKGTAEMEDYMCAPDFVVK